MKRNETFKAMLADYRPNLGDGDEYLSNLQRRLDAVEVVKQVYEGQRRQMRRRMVVAFVSGGISGVVISLYLLLHPVVLIAASCSIPSILIANINTILTILVVLVFSVLIATICTLFYQIVKRDYSTELAPRL
ncbi:MAG: hypothetical protein K5864_04790 [Bacteroidales bacterium]|nr:hypothetical protein [Bacteroidales bacterium]